MKSKSLSIALLAGALLAAGPAQSHHSFAAVYDAEKEVTIEGKVVQFQYRNPHSVLHVLAKDENGVEKRYAVEWQGATQLGAAGISAQTVHPGDAVVVKGHPGRVAAENRLLMLQIQRTTDDFSWENRGSLN
ncbi:MAG: DUF6152 family protein [Pseudomonadota bacterium]|nr:DUF6152 family protein [Pseudomonadota bacterium]